MTFPRFLVGQTVSAFDKNGSIIEGVICKTNEGKKVIKSSEDYSVPLSELKTIKFVGKRLDEEIEEKVKNFSDNKMNWEQAVKDNSDTEKLADQFGNFCAAALGDNSNKDEVKEIAKNEAEMKIIDAKVKNGVSSKDAEIAKYIDMKSDKIKEAEMNIKNKLQEGDEPFSIDYGQDNVYPVNTDTKNSTATEYENPIEENAINADADQTLMAGTHSPDTQVSDAVSPIEDEVMKDAENFDKKPMKTDMTVVEAADNYEKSLAEIDDLLKDEDETVPESPVIVEEDSSKLDNLKTEITEKTGATEEKAENIISDIKDDVESAIVHGVKDILNAYDSFGGGIDNSDIKNAIADAVYDDNEEAPKTYESFDVTSPVDYENDEVDNEVEAAIDEYIDENQDYNETDLYESLCNRFNIENKDSILLEANGIVPDAILLMTEAIRQRNR